jgi:hypothetical protein
MAMSQHSIAMNQESIANNTARDGAKMKILAILTALFLPATFMAVCPELCLNLKQPTD